MLLLVNYCATQKKNWRNTFYHFNESFNNDVVIIMILIYKYTIIHREKMLYFINKSPYSTSINQKSWNHISLWRTYMYITWQPCDIHTSCDKVQIISKTLNALAVKESKYVYTRKIVKLLVLLLAIWIRRLCFVSFLSSDTKQ